MTREPLRIEVGDDIELRKPHPCGGKVWRVERVGADIGLTCLTCGHYILLPRLEFERRVRRFVKRGNPEGAIT